jgi:hypothetical protein
MGSILEMVVTENSPIEAVISVGQPLGMSVIENSPIEAILE